MNSLRKLKMKKVKNLFTSKDDVERVRHALERKTERAFLERAKPRQKAEDLIHNERARHVG